MRIGEGSASIAGRFELPGGIRTVEIDVSREDGRAARLDGKAIRDPDELFGGLATVAFTPDDLAVVKLGPDGRRRMLDRAVQNRHPQHLADARDYLRALRSRNQLLRQRADPALLAAFDEPLVKTGARIRQRRAEVLGEIEPHAKKAFLEIARGEADLELRLSVKDTSEEALRESLAERLRRDTERGFTSTGPHADDLALAIGEKAARTYASQGQSRAVVLAFKIGEIENLRQKQGRAPLLLLDDVSSELDPERNGFLMAYLAQLKGQVVLTTTDRDLVQKSAAENALFQRVSQGRIDREN